jgi:hypothetical protein
MSKNIKCFLLGLLIGCIIFFMGDMTWGALPKNQTDPSLITDAISAAIAAHNSDPDAHMASGQSIDLHRVNDVLDHPAGSVKNDKSSFNGFNYDLKFADYSTWSKYKAGSVYSFSQDNTEIYFESSPSGAAGYNRLYKNFSNSPSILSSYFISANILTENTPGSSQYWSFGLFDSFLAVNRVQGFKYSGGKLYASLFNASANTHMDYELVGVNIFDNSEHNLRLYYDATLKQYTWFIDGSQVYFYDNIANAFPSKILPSSFGFDFNFTYSGSYDFVVHNYDAVMSVDSTY